VLFRSQWTRAIIYTLAIIYLIRGGVLVWHGALSHGTLAHSA